MFYKQRLIKPYITKNGEKHTAANLRNVGGIYIIFDLNGNAKYIGMSSNNLYRTMYRHFQSWADRTQIRIVYNPEKVKIAVCYCTDVEKIYKLEKALIIKYRDKTKLDNPNQYRSEESDKKATNVLNEYNDLQTNPVIKADEEDNYEYPF
jgi:hypothetical protein